METEEEKRKNQEYMMKSDDFVNLLGTLYVGVSPVKHEPLRI